MSTPGRVRTFVNHRSTFDVVDAGPADGPPVALLHGFPQTSACWARVTEILNAAGLRTLAPDQRGYSPGARPAGRRAYRMSELVSDVRALIAVIGEPVHLVGHDWGAAVAWASAAAAPSDVLSLTSVSVPHPAAFVRSMLSSGQALRSYYMAVFQLPWAPEAFLSDPARLRRALRGTGMTAEGADAVVREVLDSGALPYALNWYRAMPVSGPRDLLRPVTVPTTHLWGARDAFLSRRGAELAGRYARGPYRFRVVDGDHWLPEGCPEVVAEEILERVHG